MSLRRMCLVTVHLFLLGFAQPGSAQVFFESTQSHRQAVPLMGETEVVLESSLPSANVVIQHGGAANVTLDMTARYSIAGYHGSRENAGARELSGPELAFRISRSADTLTLSSPEWTYIHHALLIKQLTVTLPEAIALKLRRLLSRDLEGRR